MIKDLIIDYKPGMRINKNMVVRNMPMNVYQSTRALSNSGLKTLFDCPAKFFYKYLSGEYEPKEKPHFKIGKACHCYILEGKEAFLEIYWNNPFRCLDKAGVQAELKNRGIDFDKKALKDELMEMLLEDEGIEQKEIELTDTELNQVISVGKSIFNNQYAKNAFSQPGESELSIFWQDETGTWLKCRPDFLPYDCKLVPDYKTADSVNPQTFYSSFIKYGYHIQAAFYRTGIKAVTGIDVESFFFVAQEKEAPYITQVYLPDMHLVDFGEKAIINGINKYNECLETGVWGTYSDKIIEMSIQTRPEDAISDFDREQGLIFAPYWLDKELLKYEV